MKSLKNPKECFSIIQNKQFFVLNELCVPACEDGAEPLTLHDSTFSRFGLVIINTERKAATANIPVSEIPGIFFDMDSAIRKGEAHPASAAGPTSPAYTLQITTGSMKGKTPAQVLSEDKGTARLESQLAWLRENLSRYPKNQVQIDAITEALTLYQSGKMKNVDVSATGPVYNSGLRPLIRRKRADEKSFVYQISIDYNAGTERPVGIRIRNYYAPVVRTQTGLLNVMVKERDRQSEVANEFRMTNHEWAWFRHVIEAQIRTFEDINAPALYKMANEAASAKRFAALAAN